jgi:hypothetical protein
MVLQDSLLVTLVQLVDRLPMLTPPVKCGRGHPLVFTDRLFLKALVILIVRHLHKVNELLSVLAQPTVEMAILRILLSEQGHFPARRTWERRLKALPASLPAQRDLTRIRYIVYSMITIYRIIFPEKDARSCGGKLGHM